MGKKRVCQADKRLSEQQRRKDKGMSHMPREMEHAYTVLDEATGTEAVIDEAGSVIIFGFHDKHTELMTRVTLDAKEAYQLLQWLADYHRDFLQAGGQQGKQGEAMPS